MIKLYGVITEKELDLEHLDKYNIEEMASIIYDYTEETFGMFTSEIDSISCNKNVYGIVRINGIYEAVYFYNHVDDIVYIPIVGNILFRGALVLLSIRDKFGDKVRYILNMDNTLVFFSTLFGSRTLVYSENDTLFNPELIAIKENAKKLSLALSEFGEVDNPKFIISFGEGEENSIERVGKGPSESKEDVFCILISEIKLFKDL